MGKGWGGGAPVTETAHSFPNRMREGSQKQMEPKEAPADDALGKGNSE